jgi:hypothetical protein
LYPIVSRTGPDGILSRTGPDGILSRTGPDGILSRTVPDGLLSWFAMIPNVHNNRIMEWHSWGRPLAKEIHRATKAEQSAIFFRHMFFCTVPITNIVPMLSTYNVPLKKSQLIPTSCGR